MTSRNRDIANSIGLAVSNDTITNTGEISGGGGGTDTYSTPANLPTSGNEAGDQAFVSSNNRLYIWNGSGWYNIALINTNPSFTSSPDGSYVLAADETPTTITLVATDPEGLDITYTTTTDAGFDGLATVSNDSSVFTITPLSADSATTTSGNLTFKASDGVNIASAISEFTLIFAIENSRFTSLLTKAAGNAGTNSTFTDGSTNSHTITAVGDTHSSSFTPHHPGGYSTYFDGTGDYISTPDNAITIGTSDFTYEAWIYPTNHPGWGAIVGAPYSETGMALFNHYGGLAAYANGTLINWSGILQLNAWQHVVLTRESGSLYLYHNGVKYSSTAASSHNLTNSQYYVGTNGYGSEHFYGYINNVRVVNGTAVYTADFTPPTKPLTAIANTGLLTCHLPYIADGSTSNHTLTTSGNVYTQRFGPYDYRPYSASSHGASVYLDGSGDRITIPWHNGFDFGSGDFTIEMWYNLSDVEGLISWGSGSGDRFDITGISNNLIRVLYNHPSYSNFDNRNGSDALPNVWQHFACVRHGDTLTYYIDGVLQGTQAFAAGALMPVDTANGITIGARRYATSTSDSSQGYFKDVRIVKGTAVYTSDFTPPTAPLTAITNTSLLLQSSPNVYDASGSSNLTLYGNTQSSTTQTKNASSSMSFDGSGDLVDINSSIHFGTGPFTIEAWVKRTAATDGNDLDGVFTLNSTSDWNSPGEGLVLTARRLNYGSSTSGTNFSSRFTVDASNWYHYAVTRNNGVLKAFKDGSEVFSASDTTDYGASSQSSIGIFDKYEGSPRYHWNGYIEDLRVTEGLSRYPFIPVKETLTADTNTVLLTCHDSSVTTAASGTGATTSNLSTTGDPTATTGPRYNLHAVDFDGNDNLVIPNGNTDLGAIDGAFTIEGWVNFDAAPPGTGNGNERQIVGQSSWPESSGGDWWNMYAVSTGIYWYAAGGGGYLLTQFQTFTWETGKWYHFALTRDASDEMGLFINGSYLAPTSNATNGKGILAADVRPLSIGADNDASHNGIDGKISNLRISNIVRYTKTFTPPTSELYG